VKACYDFMTLGKKLKTLAKEQRYSQALLGRKVGVSQYQVSKWFNNKNEPSNEALAQLAEILGVSVDYLLDEGRDDSSDGDSLTKEEYAVLEAFRSHSDVLTPTAAIRALNRAADWEKQQNLERDIALGIGQPNTSPLGGSPGRKRGNRPI
jgi:transcriptional regulator with XRE-family HTH domain